MRPVDRSNQLITNRTHEAEQLQQETRRIYDSSQWVGPLGQCALGPIVVWQLWDRISAPVLLGWFLILAAASLSLTTSLIVPSLARYQSSSGMPLLAGPCHLVFGLCYGSLLWLGPDLVAEPELRWLCLTIMFAASAGVSTGLAGLDKISMSVLGPTWTLGSLALVVKGQPTLGAGTLLFLVIVTIDQRRSGDLFRELIALRVDRELRAESNAWAASHDDLTGLLNRSGVLTGLNELESQPVTAMYIDLDYFKAVNDQLGHGAGDQVLTEVGRRLSEHIREEDLVGRFGGDEFFVVFARHIPSARAEQLGRNIIDAIEHPIDTQFGAARVSASIGVAVGVCESGKVDDIINRADGALIRAKRAGRGRALAATDGR